MLRRKKVNDDGDEFRHLQRRRFLNSSPPSVVQENSDDPCASSASCCSSNVEKLSSQDLQEQEVSSGGVEMEATATFNVEETKSQVSSTVAPPSAARSFSRATEAKMPSDVELEEFFSAAVKDIQKQFSKKYNFDIVKEEPLEGRYEWVELKR